jgi:hypothetical protein
MTIDELQKKLLALRAELGGEAEMMVRDAKAEWGCLSTFWWDVGKDEVRVEAGDDGYNT